MNSESTLDKNIWKGEKASIIINKNVLYKKLIIIKPIMTKTWRGFSFISLQKSMKLSNLFIEVVII